MSGVRLEVVEEESVERFAHEAMLGLADLESEDLAHGQPHRPARAEPVDASGPDPGRDRP